MHPFTSFLSATGLFSESAIEQSLPLFEPVILYKNEFLVQEGSLCTKAGFVLKGAIRAFSTADNGLENVTCFRFENTFVTDYEGYFQRNPAKKSLQTMETTELLLLDSAKLPQLLDTVPQWRNLIGQLTESEFREKEDYLLQYNNKTAKEKYRTLLENQTEIAQRVNVDFIASYLGINQRTLSRVKKELLLEKCN